MLVAFEVEDLNNDLLESSVQDEVQNNTQEDVNTEKQKKKMLSDSFCQNSLD